MRDVDKSPLPVKCEHDKDISDEERDQHRAANPVDDLKSGEVRMPHSRLNVKGQSAEAGTYHDPKRNCYEKAEKSRDQNLTSIIGNKLTLNMKEMLYQQHWSGINAGERP